MKNTMLKNEIEIVCYPFRDFFFFFAILQWLQSVSGWKFYYSIIFFCTDLTIILFCCKSIKTECGCFLRHQWLWSFALHRSQGCILLTQAPSNCKNDIFEQAFESWPLLPDLPVLSDDRSEVDGSVVSMVSATSSSSRLLPPKERLREKAFQYCQRLIEQSDRSECARVTLLTGASGCLFFCICTVYFTLVADVMWVFSLLFQRLTKRQIQTCRKRWACRITYIRGKQVFILGPLFYLSCFFSQCLVEAVCILDCVCVEDTSLVFRTFPCIKGLFGRLSSDLSFARVLLPIAQFYLNHGVYSHPRVHMLNLTALSYLHTITSAPWCTEDLTVNCVLM